jgi:hypothetical protein
LESFERFAEIDDEQILAEETCPVGQLSSGTGPVQTLAHPRRAQEQDSWDGRAYTIVPSKAITTDLTLPPMFERIPMPGKPSDFETADIVKQAIPRRNTTPGAHRFSMRANGELELEGATLAQLSHAISSKTSDKERRTVEVSADGHAWLPLAAFIQLSSHDFLSPNAEMPPGAYVSKLADSSIARIFARTFEHQSTGKLTFIMPRGDLKQRTEIQLLRGAPVHIASSDVSLEMPAQLIRSRLIDGDDLRVAVHSSLALKKPFTKLVSERIGIDVTKMNVRFASERLESLVGHREGSFSISTSTPEQTRPISTSLLPFLTGIYRRGMSPPGLHRLIAPQLEHTFLRTMRFERYLEELRLTNTESYAVRGFGHTRTLRQAIASITDERFALASAYLFLELGMIAAIA